MDSSYDLACKLLRLSGSPEVEEARSAAYMLARMIDRGEVALSRGYTGKCTMCKGVLNGGSYERGKGIRCKSCSG